MKFVTILAVLFVLDVCNALPPISPAQRSGLGRNELIRLYFMEGFEYKLKRVLKSMGLRRRHVDRTVRPGDSGVRRLIEDELREAGSLLGYRSLWRRLRLKHGIIVSRDHVMTLLRQIDPEDSTARKCRRLCRRTYRNKGPNYVWHCDGYDKLKPYGFPIHGCIDGYSRRILWLEVGTSNNKPGIIAHYYLETVKNLKGTPRVLRCDRGTENCNLAFIQPFLRRNGTDCFAENLSFRYGKSVSNQRIEAWWSFLKRTCAQWWIDLFKSMQHCGLFDETNRVHVDCLRLCFMHLIKSELDRVAHEWNTHRIRCSRNGDSIGGIPDELYFLPQIQGTTNYLCDVTWSDLHEAEPYAEIPDPPASLEFLRLAQIEMEEHNIELAQSVENALSVYIELLAAIEHDLQNYAGH